MKVESIINLMREFRNKKCPDYKVDYSNKTVGNYCVEYCHTRNQWLPVSYASIQYPTIHMNYETALELCGYFNLLGVVIEEY